MRLYLGTTIVARWFSMSFWPRLKADLLTAMLCRVLYLLTGTWYWKGSGFQSADASLWPLLASSSSSARTVDVLPSDQTTSTFGCCCCWVAGAGKPTVPTDVPLICTIHASLYHARLIRRSCTYRVYWSVEKLLTFTHA